MMVCAIDTTKTRCLPLQIRFEIGTRLGWIKIPHIVSQVCADVVFITIVMSSTIRLFFAVLLTAAFVVAVRSHEGSIISGDVENVVQNEPISDTVIYRKKRYLDFIPLSRMFVIN